MTHFIIKLYNFLLSFYPATFQNEFREQMLLDFSDLVSDAYAKGKLSLLRFCVREVLDYPINLLRVHIKESPMFRLFRSQPVNFGLRGAVGFGVIYALTFPIIDFMYDKLSCIETLVTLLQVSYYDQHHVEKSFDLFSQIPYLLGLLMTGLLLGCLFAFLFARRSQYPRYVLTGMVGWIFLNLTGNAIMAFNLRVYLTGIQYTYLGYMMFVLSGAMWGLIFVTLKSERYDAVRWLAGCVIAYPLFTYLWMKGLFSLFVFQTPWRFVGVTLFFVIMLASVFVIARKMGDSQSITWVVTGIIGYLLIIPLVYFVGLLVYPPMTSLSTALDNLSITVSNVIYGSLLGLFLGVVIGFQNSNTSQQATT